MASIDDRRRYRAAFMRALYEKSGGYELNFLNVRDLISEVDVPADEVRGLIQYLEGEYLIKAQWAWGGEPIAVQIQHPGVVEVEAAIADPDRSTEHFAPINSITIYGGVHNSQVGVAGGDLSQQAAFQSARTDAVRAWLDDYRAALPELDEILRPVAEQQLDQIAAEVAKPEPQEAVVNGLLGSLRAFAQSAVAAAGAGAGTMALAEVVAHWPL